MTAQNTKTIQYRLRNGQSVEVTINNDGVPGEKVSISDLAIEKTIMCHLGFTEEVSKKHGVAIWSAMDTGMRKFITARTPGMTMMDLMQIAPLFECEPLDVFSNPAICQQLYGEMKLAVNLTDFGLQCIDHALHHFLDASAPRKRNIGESFLKLSFQHYAELVW